MAPDQNTLAKPELVARNCDGPRLLAALAGELRTYTVSMAMKLGIKHPRVESASRLAQQLVIAGKHAGNGGVSNDWPLGLLSAVNAVVRHEGVAYIVRTQRDGHGYALLKREVHPYDLEKTSAQILERVRPVQARPAPTDQPQTRQGEPTGIGL